MTLLERLLPVDHCTVNFSAMYPDIILVLLNMLDSPLFRVLKRFQAALRTEFKSRVKMAVKPVMTFLLPVLPRLYPPLFLQSQERPGPFASIL